MRVCARLVVHRCCCDGWEGRGYFVKWGRPVADDSASATVPRNGLRGRGGLFFDIPISDAWVGVAIVSAAVMAHSSTRVSILQ